MFSSILEAISRLHRLRRCVQNRILHRISLASHFSSFIQFSVLRNVRAMSFTLAQKETRKNK